MMARRKKRRHWGTIEDVRAVYARTGHPFFKAMLEAEETFESLSPEMERRLQALDAGVLDDEEELLPELKLRLKQAFAESLTDAGTSAEELRKKLGLSNDSPTESAD